MSSHLIRFGLLAALSGGCGDPQSSSYPNRGESLAEYSMAPESAPLTKSFQESPTGLKKDGLQSMAELAQNPPPAGTELVRKIIYDAQIDLAIDDIDSTSEKLVDLIQSNQGYLAEQNITGSPGTRRSGLWKVRVPVERFEDFIQSLLGLGELERNHRTSQDVTEQFYDVEARIKNQKVEEQTLLKLLEERGGKLEDVLKVEVELSRVRGEIEQMQGRLRVLANLSSLATVTINLREREKYEPVEPVVASFSTQLSRAWGDSIKEFTDGVKGVIKSFARNWIRLLLWLLGLLIAFAAIRAIVVRLVRYGPRLLEIAHVPIGASPPRRPEEPRR
jgi:Domain of unknown function (DUF4349)